MNELENIRRFCSDYICKTIGEKYDSTPWMNKLELYALYKQIRLKIGGNYATKVCNDGQEN